MRLIQFKKDDARYVGLIEEDGIHATTLNDVRTVYELASRAESLGTFLADLASTVATGPSVDYAALLRSRSVLAPLDHPEPARFLVTGTGLTHIGSADARNKMHVLARGGDAADSDSLKIFKMGLDGRGKPLPGELGVQPEWFFKGLGTCVVAPEEDLPLPSFAEAGAEEAEIVGLYLIDRAGNPRRIGYAVGNEFSDHVTESENYLYLAHSKLRACSFGPELLVGELPQEVTGTSRVLRDGAVLWEGELTS